MNEFISTSNRAPMTEDQKLMSTRLVLLCGISKQKRSRLPYFRLQKKYMESYLGNMPKGTLRHTRCLATIQYLEERMKEEARK